METKQQFFSLPENLKNTILTAVKLFYNVYKQLLPPKKIVVCPPKFTCSELLPLQKFAAGYMHAWRIKAHSFKIY